MTSQFILRSSRAISSEPLQSHSRPLITETAPLFPGQSEYRWEDAVWMGRRVTEEPEHSPVSIYRLYPFAWRRGADGEPLGWRSLALALVPYVADLGFTHVELMDVGHAALDSEFAYFVDRCHEGGIGVILEWPQSVSAHQNGSGPVRDVLNYLDGFHLDGLRLPLPHSKRIAQSPYATDTDAETMRELLDVVASRRPEVLLLSRPDLQGSGAEQPTARRALTWDTGFPERALAYLSQPPEARGSRHRLLVDGLNGAFSRHFVLPLADEASSEGRETWLNRMPGDRWQQFATIRACLGFMWAHPGKKLLGMGTEFAQDKGWRTHGRLDWSLLRDEYHMGVFRLVADLNRIYGTEPALHLCDRSPESFSWVVGDDSSNSVFAFLRHGDRGMAPLLAIANFTPTVHHDYRLGVPALGLWREILNSDSEFYGGSNVGNAAGARAEQIGSHGYPASLSLTIPPLATLLLRQGDWPS